MAGSVVYTPEYRLYLTKQGKAPGQPSAVAAPRGAAGRFAAQFGTPAPLQATSTPLESWSLKTLKAAQVNLSTTAVGTATFSVYDQGKYLTQTVEPHAMNVADFLITNRFGQWGQIWCGYLDEPHRIIDPTQGEVMELASTSPYKLFEITSQTPGDVQTLATAYMQNVSGSQVLKYAAQACGFPSSMLVIDSTADSGSGLWQSIPSGVFIDPDQQKWSAVLQNLLGNSGLECFTDELGQLHWRPVGYLNYPKAPVGYGPTGSTLQPRPVLEDEILHADLAESDATAVTYVEVRYGIIPTTYGAPNWQAPAGMVSHLRQRRLIVHAPWIQNAAAAQYLATALGQMYAANLLVGSVTIPADPAFQLGTLCQVPVLRSDQSTGVYYISAITYNLVWGEQWTMTLGLSYGRAPNQQFPYIGSIAKPVLTAEAQSGFPSQKTAILSYDSGNPNQISNGFTVLANSTLANTVVVVDPNLGLTDGTVVYLRNKAGHTIGPTPNGEYVTQSGTAGSGTTLYVQSTANLDSTGQGYLTIRQGSPATTTATSGAQGLSAAQTTGQPATGTATWNAPSPPSTTPGAPTGGTLAVRALQAALTLKGQPYGLGMAGPTAWDCSGLVVWAYTSLNYNPQTSGQPWLPSPGPHFGPSLLYQWFLAHGAKAWQSVNQAQPGDLLFIIEPQPWGNNYWANQAGFSHVAFCYSAGGFNGGWQFGADSKDLGIALLPIAGFLSFNGTAFKAALDMSQVTMTS